jgi:hypothetical protein
MTSLSQPAETAGSDHPPARSGTPTAWAALVLVALLVMGWLFADRILCGVIRTGAAAVAWKRGETLRLGRLDFDASGSLRATDIEWSRGAGDHRSTFRCDMAILMPASLRDLVLPRRGHDRLWIRELWLAKTRLLLDAREDRAQTSGSVTPAKGPGFVFPPALLPGSLYAGPVEAVFIGEMGRLAIHDLRLDLPSRWTGRVAFRAAEADLGAGHRAIPGGTARAYWEPGSLRLGNLSLGEGLSLGECSLRLLPGRLDFGLRGTIGKGLLRGDGSIGGNKPLELTLVGEQLGIDAVTGLVSDVAGASGTIDQARLSFRGDPARPMDADGSIRLVGRNFRWENRGWESLRLAASMTGRNLTLSELALRQGENELVAEGRSSLPADWHALLRAPFTANFRASLADAGSLASLFGPDATALGGSLYLDGSVRGADNKAEGYCNFSGLGTKFRRLTVDWVKGCLLFEGATTRISHVEAAAGRDAISLRGSVGNSSPHAYQGEAEISVQDLARRLGELGFTVSPAIGAGALSGSWKGEGDAATHRGEFRARFTEWVSRWTKGGLSGNVEGSYAPDSLTLSKAQMIKEDLTLSLGVTATPQRLDLTSISVIKTGSKKPLATGQISLPLSLVDFWTGGDPIKTLVLDQPSTVNLQADGLRVEQLADLLGQTTSSTGKLEGWFTAGGTPAAPQLNASLTIAGFSPGAGIPPGDLSLAVQTVANETTARVHQQNKTEILHGECTLPIKLGKSGVILVPDPATKLHGSLRMNGLPLDGWISLLAGSSALPLRTITSDGEATVSGTVAQPLAQGHLELKAAKADLCDAHQLESLSLPMVFSNATATLKNGTARFRGEPVALTGSAEWATGATPPKLSLRLGGTNLPFDLAPGLPAKVTADLNYTMTSTSPATLGGTLLVDPIRSDLAKGLVPVFCPPGLQIPTAPASTGRPGAPRLDLTLASTTNATVQGGPLVSLNLHLTGTGDDPSAEGSITVINQTLRLPGGRFQLPFATVAFSKEGNRLAGTASGITGAGLGALRLGGSLEHPTAAIDAGGVFPAADGIFACAMPSQPAASSILQAPFWLRQHQLFPVPARFWSTGPQGEADPSALGFFGTPWIWSLTTCPPEGAVE